MGNLANALLINKQVRYSNISTTQTGSYLWGKMLFDTLRTERCWTEPRSRAEQTWKTHRVVTFECCTFRPSLFLPYCTWLWRREKRKALCLCCVCKCIYIWLYVRETEYDLGANQYVQWQADSWLHLRLINKLDLALGPTSIHHIRYSDHFTSSGQQHRLSGCIQVDYIHCNTDISGWHFILQCCIMWDSTNCMFTESHSLILFCSKCVIHDLYLIIF